MPLFDHFHSPLHPQRHWEAFHSSWANTIAEALNDDLLPQGYFAEPETHATAGSRSMWRRSREGKGLYMLLA
jgi:hypothetical protein